MPGDRTMQLPRLLPHFALVALYFTRLLPYLATIPCPHGLAAITRIIA